MREPPLWLDEDPLRTAAGVGRGPTSRVVERTLCRDPRGHGSPPQARPRVGGHGENKILARLHTATTTRTKLVADLSLWVVTDGSKLIVLELVNLVFGDSVRPGASNALPDDWLVVAMGTIAMPADSVSRYGTASTVALLWQ
jgi:hypothetical protein